MTIYFGLIEGFEPKTCDVKVKKEKKQEQKVLKTSAPRVNFMFSKQKVQKHPLKSHKKFRNSLKGGTKGGGGLFILKP